MFCSCGSMMFPKDGKYVCNSCGATKEIGGKAEIIKTKENEKVTTVLSDTPATLPKTNVQCPKCGYAEAYYTIRQTRAADEPETMIYRCCKCNETWREY